MSEGLDIPGKSARAGSGKQDTSPDDAVRTTLSHLFVERRRGTEVHDPERARDGGKEAGDPPSPRDQSSRRGSKGSGQHDRRGIRLYPALRSCEPARHT